MGSYLNPDFMQKVYEQKKQTFVVIIDGGERIVKSARDFGERPQLSSKNGVFQ